MMAATAKLQKDKPYSAAPRLKPRPTAASAARAARNATNRNINLPNNQRVSPGRAPPSPTTSRIKNNIQRNSLKSDSKSEIKINRSLENYSDQPVDMETNQFIEKQDSDVSYTIENEHATTMEKTDEQTVLSSAVDIQQTLEPPLDLHSTDNISMKPEFDTSITGNIDSKRPCTPVLCTPVLSRPLTPIVSNRPQTPRISSRPSTPGNTGSRASNPPSRPITPQLTRPKTPVSALARPVTPVLPCPNLPKTSSKDQEDVKTEYFAKHNQFNRLKKELDLKQQAILEVFDSLQKLQDRMSKEGLSGSGEGLQELKMFNVADWACEEISQLCRDAAAASETDGAGELINNVIPFDECEMAELETKATNIPNWFADLCLQAFSTRQELIDWVKELVGNEPNNEKFYRISQLNAHGLELCDGLRELKSSADEVVNDLIQTLKRSCQERTTLIAVGQTLVRNVAKLRDEIESRATVCETQKTCADTETAKLLEETRRELEDEKVSKISIKEKLATAESQLRQARLRVSKMDKQLRESEASIASLTGTVKTLEDQSRQKEVHLEARARKLKESLKTGEVASSQLSQQRDNLQKEVLELKAQIELLASQQKSNAQDLNKQIKELVTALEEERKATQREIDQKNALEKSLRESNGRLEELRSKISELENSLPNPDLPTEREMDLWAELQATKDVLRATEDEMTACKKEKVRFLETLTKITESDNKVGQQKLAAELSSKVEIIGKMQMQIRDLTKNIKLNEQKVTQYEQYVRDLQAHNRAVANCQESPGGVSYEDLQQENMNLRMGLLDAVHRSDDLSELLSQKDQQIEEQNKTSRAQARLIKVREELINMLKNKETEQSRELSALQQDLEHRMKIVDDVNKQIASKAEAIQELFATLENKQQQIHRLEKIVLALEEQQRRAQAQRTRHEEKIAALEHELAANGKRERKFLFF